MNNNRLNKQCALLIKSRVALYEATFEKYHQGTGRVPGDETWPGKSVHPNFSLDVTAEINFFLDQCMDAASQVADAITLTENTGVFNPLSDSEYSGWNPYFEMFSAEDMSGYSEVLSERLSSFGKYQHQPRCSQLYLFRWKQWNVEKLCTDFPDGERIALVCQQQRI